MVAKAAAAKCAAVVTKGAAKAVKGKPARLKSTPSAKGALAKAVHAASPKKVKSVSKKDFRPSISVERSRKQVLCLTGRRGDPSTKVMFKDVGDEAKAIAKGKRWISNFNAIHKKHFL